MTQANTGQPGILSRLYAFLASVKLTLAVLLLLAATSVIGTLIPQNAEPAAYLRAYGDVPYRLLRVFDVFDMYHSWWFQALIGLLAANIVVCTVRRWPSTWRIVASRNPAIGSNGSASPLAEFSDARPPQELSPLYTGYITSRFRSHRIEPGENGFRIMAERGRWTRLGVPVVHLSVVLILIGALIGSVLGFEGFVNIPEGGQADRIQLRSRTGTIPLGFEIRCDDFNVSYYDSGAPKEYRSSLSVLENGRPVIAKDIIVNDPLQYRGINFFQSSYGSLPPSDFELSFTRKGSGEAVRHRVSIGQSVELPENAGRFTAREYRPEYRHKNTDVGETVLGVLNRPGVEPTTVTLPLRFPSFDKMRKDEWGIAIEGYDRRYYTGLQVTRDPGVPLVYAGFILMIIGCWVAFFMSHQKVAIDVAGGAKLSRVKLLGSVNRHRIGFENRTRRLAEELSHL